MKRIYKPWSDEEKEEFFNLIREHKNVHKAAILHAANTGRSVNTLYSTYSLWKAKNKVPEDCIREAQSKKRWSENEKKLLLKAIAENPQNFSIAYREIAQRTGRTEEGVRFYFERYRRKEDANVLMLNIGGKKRCSPNRKNIHSKTGGTMYPVKLPWWKKILKILGL